MTSLSLFTSNHPDNLGLEPAVPDACRPVVIPEFEDTPAPTFGAPENGRPT